MKSAFNFLLIWPKEKAPRKRENKVVVAVEQKPNSGTEIGKNNNSESAKCCRSRSLPSLRGKKGSILARGKINRKVLKLSGKKGMLRCEKKIVHLGGGGR